MSGICQICGSACRKLYGDRCRKCSGKSYDTPEWKAIVQETRVRDGYRCLETFTLPDTGRTIKTGGCGKTFPPKDLQCAHIVPRADGGIDDPMNAVTLCRANHAQQTAGQDRGFGNPPRTGYMNKQLTREERERRTKKGGCLPFSEVLLPGDLGDDDERDDE
jgi:5-methylcytosine-specific restriction endonuclease McrA